MQWYLLLGCQYVIVQLPMYSYMDDIFNPHEVCLFLRDWWEVRVCELLLRYIGKDVQQFYWNVDDVARGTMYAFCEWMVTAKHIVLILT